MKFRETSNYCERVLEAVKLAYTNAKPITSQNFDSRNFWQIASNVLNKGKSITPLFNGPEVLYSA